MEKEKKDKKLSRFLVIALGREKDYFIENLSMLISSGMGIFAVLDAIKEETRSRRMRKIIDFIKEEIDAGSPLWRALEKVRFLSRNIISLVRIGEESGRLQENLEVIAIQQQKERIFRSQLHSAMIYPIFVFTLLIAVGTGISWFILPRLSSVFLSMDVELPVITKWVIVLGGFLEKYGAVAIPTFLLLLLFFIYFVFIFSKTKFIGQKLLLTLPGTKKIIKEIELGRFGYIFGTLLDAGLPIGDSLQSLYQSTDFGSYKKLYKHLLKSVEEGNSFKKSFKLYRKINKLIPYTIQQVIVSGEISGQLAGTLLKIGDMFEKKAEISAKNLTVILEPILLVIIWFGVLAVALAVIMPIYSLIGSLNK